MFIKIFCILILLNVSKASSLYGHEPFETKRPDSTDETLKPAVDSMENHRKVISRLNIFVLNRSRKLDMANLSIRIHCYLAKLFHPDLKIIQAESCADLADKLGLLMNKHPGKRIGHLWFDSHGKYKTGSSIFYIGRDTIGMMNVLSPGIREPFRHIAAYCDRESRITLGSCYSAAGYIRPGYGSFAVTRMDGDILLLSVASLFPGSRVYGCESWIMVKPFMFGRKWGIAGYPLASRYRDIIYYPAWERMGKWKVAETGRNETVSVITPYLTRNGDLAFNSGEYLSVRKHRKKLHRTLRRLRPGMYRADKK